MGYFCNSTTGEAKGEKMETSTVVYKLGSPLASNHLEELRSGEEVIISSRSADSLSVVPVRRIREWMDGIEMDVVDYLTNVMQAARRPIHLQIYPPIPEFPRDATRLRIIHADRRSVEVEVTARSN